MSSTLQGLRNSRQLSSICRSGSAIFIAHRLENLSYREIAELTGLTIEQVEHHIARAMVKLMKQMDGDRLSFAEHWFP